MFLSAFRNVIRCLFNPPLDFMPALYAGLMMVIGSTYLLRPRLFEITHAYRVMDVLPEWAWGLMALLLGLAVAGLSKGPPEPLRYALGGCAVYLSVVTFTLWIGPVGYDTLSAVLAYMAVGAGWAYVGLGRVGGR